MNEDVYIKELPTRLDNSTIVDLSALTQSKSLLQVVLQWTYVLISILTYNFAITETRNPWVYVPIYLLTVVCIGSRQHAMGILLHEAVHYRICNNKTINNFIGEWLLAWPLSSSLYGYRQQHFAHHRSVGDANDPDFARVQNVEKYAFPKTKSQILVILGKYAFGYYSFYDGREAMQQLVVGIPMGLQLKRLAAYAALISASIYWNFWLGLILFWLIPSMTMLLLVMYIRLIAEHGVLPKGHSVFARSRHVDPAFWEKILIAPLGVNYHLDHHLYPAVPFYKLPKLHEILLRDAAYANGAHITKGYVGGLLLKECMQFGKR